MNDLGSNFNTGRIRHHVQLEELGWDRYAVVNVLVSPGGGREAAVQA